MQIDQIIVLVQPIKKSEFLKWFTCVVKKSDFLWVTYVCSEKSLIFFYKWLPVKFKKSEFLQVIYLCS